MPFLVTDSAVLLPAETLPALKVTEFEGQPARGCVYAYLRCYVHGGDLHYSVSVFDEAPPDSARIGLAVTMDDSAAQYLFLSLGRGRAAPCTLYAHGAGADAPVRALSAPPPRFVGGSDEQGGYWGAEGVLPARLWRDCFGDVPHTGAILPGNVFLYDTAEAAFGSAFAVPAGARVPTAEGFSTFVIVPY